MATTKKTTKPVKKAEPKTEEREVRYVAEWNQRIDGVVRGFSYVLTRKDGEFYDVKTGNKVNIPCGVKIELL